MTPLSVSERERQRLESIALEYEAQGYEVKLKPAPAEMPNFLAGFRPDLIAVGKGESVVVEVRTWDQLKEERPMLALEQALRNRPGWRFELIINRPIIDEEQQAVDVTEIRASLNEGDELQKHGHLAAALLVLWSATEGALRLLANRENIELEFPTAGYMVKRLYTLGLLARVQYQVLEEIMKLRNRAAHGFQVSVTPDDLRRIAEVLSELLSEVEMRAA